MKTPPLILALLVASALPASTQGPETPPSEAGRIVLVRSTGDLLEDGPRFARALCASGVGGRPACLLVGEELSRAQSDLLARLEGAELVCVGEPPERLAGAVSRRVADPFELFAPSEGAVVTSLHLADVLEAAPEAYRRGVPLLQSGPDLERQLERLGVRRVWTVAPREGVALPEVLAREDLGDAARRWAALCASGDVRYLAVANLHPGRSWTTGSPLAAAVLAARHGGVLLALEEPVEFRYAHLERVREAPPGLDPDGARSWLTGAFETAEGPLGVAVPQAGAGIGLSGFMPKFGAPILDLDRDGEFEPAGEEIEIGAVARVGAREASVSLRLIGALGTTKFHDGQRTERAVAVSPPAEAVAARLLELYADRGLPDHLLLAGDHRELPFDYVADPVYAAQFMHEQELASDNLYADPDGDGYLDLAVGRLVASGPAQATTLAARLATYDLWARTGGPPEACLIYPAWASDEAELGFPSIFASFKLAVQGMGLDTARAGFENHLHLREEGSLERTYPNLGTSSLVVFAHHSGPVGWQFRARAAEDGFEVDLLASPRDPELAPPARAVPFLAGAPLIIGAGCDSAGLDYEVSLETSIVHAFFEEGAVGYIGNTRAGFPDTEEFLLRHTLQGVLGLLPREREPLSAGEAFRRGKNYLGFLIRRRGPFRSAFPFEDYSPAMRREWTSLVYFGDPALRLALPGRRAGSPVEVRAWIDGQPRVRLQFEGDPRSFPIWIPRRVGFGPIEEVTGVTAAGLSYGSVPWSAIRKTAEPGAVGPGVFLDLPVPEGLRLEGTARVAEGPAWSLGAAEVVTDALGERRLLLSVDFVRYAMADPESLEVAGEVEVVFE